MSRYVLDRPEQPCNHYNPQPSGFCYDCGWHRIDHAMSAGGIGHPQKETTMGQKKAPKRYQHRTPQRPEEQTLPYHAVQPHHNDRGACAICLAPIKAVAANDGPEALKSLFRF